MDLLSQSVPVASGRKLPGRAARLGQGTWRILAGLWKFLLGVVFTQVLPGALIVAGWVYRSAQREVRKSWWRLSRLSEPLTFSEFTQGSVYHRGLDRWPNWILANGGAVPVGNRSHGVGTIRHAVRRGFHSLGLNFKIGIQVVFNTAVLTMPGCVLMLFSWYFGWHNSFNKGYEQAAVGPVLGLAGIGLFIAAMYYVPMAQMRQASTGDWRSFYQFRLVWKLVQKNWLGCLLLAGLYALFSLPITILKTVPMFLPQIHPPLAELPPGEALRFAVSYYLYAAVPFFAIFLGLRLAAARIYARSLVACVQSGALMPDALAENEWETLHRLRLLEARPAREAHVLVRTATWLGSRVGRITTGIALFFVWFAFVAQIYVSEFFNKSEYGRGWLNQPLVQLPWFNYVPGPLREAARADSSAREQR